MKNTKFKIIIIVAIAAMSLAACKKSGTTIQKLYGTEEALPQELKGLKVYTVHLDENGNTVMVAILDNDINSVTYREGKQDKTAIVINKDSYDERIIIAKEVVMENDSLMVIKK